MIAHHSQKDGWKRVPAFGAGRDYQENRALLDNSVFSPASQRELRNPSGWRLRRLRRAFVVHTKSVHASHALGCMSLLLVNVTKETRRNIQLRLLKPSRSHESAESCS